MFIYLFICKVIKIKVNFRFSKPCSQDVHVIFAKEPLFAKEQNARTFLRSNIRLYIDKAISKYQGNFFIFMIEKYHHVRKT